ncbi:UDP-glucose 4-epimerase family protein [Candidatus Raskinella chloraquaticus]|uniref:NAD-dependent epimerase/dehydratase domain-containing protein n=1 Tax=Candidatus Raskinella chloraquaticus TaxID=1951219 RepID=A0A1W9HRG6_9HYPH|nr:MAG: hypothetical protein A4S15_13985 [Proteobacteria bacterium SG_bin8]
MNVLITGANGFVGRALASHLAAEEAMTVRVAVRRLSRPFPASVDVRDNLDLDDADWSSALRTIDVVIHCAARVHVRNDTATDAIAEFRKTNTDGTLKLAKKAAEAGVKRFIYLSTIKVNGNSTNDRPPFSANDIPAPTDPYGMSKMEAEIGLLELAKKTGLDIVIIRPPLVYGPGVKANFLSLMRLVNWSIPMPFGRIDNKRSFVAIDNLVDFIKTCCVHPSARNQIFMVSDGADLSTTHLIRMIGQALGKPTYLIPTPSNLMFYAARMFGKAEIADRLIGSLQVDIEKNNYLLNWTPPVKMDDALKQTADMFLKR